MIYQEVAGAVMRLLRAVLVFVGLWLLWTFVIALLFRAAGKENIDFTMQAVLWMSALQMIVQKIITVVKRHRQKSSQNKTGLDPLVAARVAIDQVLRDDDFSSEGMSHQRRILPCTRQGKVSRRGKSTTWAVHKPSSSGGSTAILS